MTNEERTTFDSFGFVLCSIVSVILFFAALCTGSKLDIFILLVLTVSFALIGASVVLFHVHKATAPGVIFLVLIIAAVVLQNSICAMCIAGLYLSTVNAAKCKTRELTLKRIKEEQKKNRRNRHRNYRHNKNRNSQKHNRENRRHSQF